MATPPEDVFVASANICLMTTFLAVAERAGLAFASYESSAEGRLEPVAGKYQFTALTLKPVITLPAGGIPDRSPSCWTGSRRVSGPADAG